MASTEQRASRLTGILAKRPTPGAVKTRLTPPLAPHEAAELALAMLEDVVRRGCLEAACSTPRLVFAPIEEESWFRERFSGRIELIPQRGRDLSERLATFFEEAFSEDAVQTVVAVGSDAPGVPAARLAEAHERLEAGADLVLGPDLGGGYYLIGMRAPHPELFLEVTMSTAHMGQETVALAQSRGLEVTRLATDYDIDVEADLRRLVEDLERRDPASEDFPRATAGAIKALELP